MLKRALVILSALFLLLGATGCEWFEDSPTSPTPEEDLLYFVQGSVRIYSTPTPVKGAVGYAEDQHTHEVWYFRTNDSGVTDEKRWQTDPTHSGLRVVLEPQFGGGVMFESFDQEVSLSCNPHPENREDAVLCRWTAELVPQGIG